MRYRAEFTGRVLTRGIEASSTSKVMEEGTGIVHYLYLYSGSARKQVLADDPYDFFAEPAVGDTVRVRLEGTAEEGLDAPPPGTTAVRTTDRDGTLGRPRFVHYLNTASPSVTGPDAPAPRPGRVVAELTGTIVSDERQEYGTRKVRDEAGVIHYLYVNARASREEFLTDDPYALYDAPKAGDVLKVRLEAAVKAADGSEPAGTTRVLSPNGYAHFLDLASPYVTDPDARITARNEVISSRRVILRLEALRQLRDGLPLTCQLVRIRDGALKGTFGTRDAVLAYLDEQDLNAGRFTIEDVPGKLGEEDAAELAVASRLDEDGRAAFGEDAWTKGVTLRPAGYYDAAWARGVARERLSLDEASVNSWPLSLIDWDDAAVFLLARDYASVTAAEGGKVFYSQVTPN